MLNSMGARQNILAIASKEIGVTELPPNSNKTKYGQWFGLDGVAWCAIFCSWCYATARSPLTIHEYSKGFAGVPFALNYYRSHGNITANPQPADLVIFDWNNDKQPDHVGLFGGWTDRDHGMFWTIEGNTSPTNQSNGGAVMKRERHISIVEAFINPLNLPS